MFTVNLQGLFVAWDIAHHRVGRDTCKNGGCCAQCYPSEPAVLYLEDK